MKKWPKDGDIVSAEDLVGPVIRVLFQGYRLMRRTKAKLRYDGFEIGGPELACCLNAKERFTRSALAYDQERGRKLLHVAAYLIFQLGIEQGRRMAKKDSRSDEAFFRLEGNAEGHVEGVYDALNLVGNARENMLKRVERIKERGLDPTKGRVKHDAQILRDRLKQPIEGAPFDPTKHTNEILLALLDMDLPADDRALVADVLIDRGCLEEEVLRASIPETCTHGRSVAGTCGRCDEEMEARIERLKKNSEGLTQQANELRAERNASAPLDTDYRHLRVMFEGYRAWAAFGDEAESPYRPGSIRDFAWRRGVEWAKRDKPPTP